jgi:hypothetical protein
VKSESRRFLFRYAELNSLLSYPYNTKCNGRTCIIRLVITSSFDYVTFEWKKKGESWEMARISREALKNKM